MHPGSLSQGPFWAVTSSSAKCTGSEWTEVPSVVPRTLKAAIVETNAPPKLPVRGPVRGFKRVETAETDCKVPVVFDEAVVPVFGKPVTVDTVPEAVAGACTICAV